MSTQGPDDVPEIDEPSIRLDRKGVAQGMAWNSITTLVAKLVFPIVGIYVTRKLGVKVTGDFALLTSLIAVCEVLRDGGLLQTYLAEAKLTRDLEREYEGAALLTGNFPSLLILLSTPFLPAFFDAPFLAYGLPITAFTMSIQSLTIIPAARMNRQARFRELAILNLSLGTGGFLALVLLVSLGFGVNALFVQMVIGPLVGLVVMRRMTRSFGISFEIRPVLKRIRTSGILLITNLTNNVFLMSDVYVIQSWLGAPFTGYYNYAQNIGYKPAEAIVFPLSRTLLVAFSQNAGDLEKLRSAFARSIAAVIGLVLPIFFFFAIYAEPIVLLLGGQSFLGAAQVLRILSIYLGLRALGGISGYTLVPLGKHKWTLIPWIGAVAFTFFGLRQAIASPATADHLAVWSKVGFSDVLGFRIEPAEQRAKELSTVVWIYTGGAFVAYGWVISLAFRYLPPGPDGWAKLGRSMLALACTALFLLAVSKISGLEEWGRLLLAALTVPFFHLVAMGTIIERTPLSYLSIGGIKRLWHTL